MPGWGPALARRHDMRKARDSSDSESLRKTSIRLVLCSGSLTSSNSMAGLH